MVSFQKFTLSVVIGAIAVVLTGCPACNDSDDKKGKDAPGGENDWKAMKAPAKECVKVFPDNNSGVAAEDSAATTLKDLKEACTKKNKEGEGKDLTKYAKYCVAIEFISTESSKKEDAKGTGKLLMTAAKYEKEPKDSGSANFATEAEPNNECLTSSSGLKYAKDGQKKEAETKKSFAQTRTRRGTAHQQLRN